MTPSTDTKRRLPFFALLAVIGPGIIAASAGNDAGGISTYSVAGAKYGYAMLWMMLAMTPSFMIVQEMAGRMGAVTGKGFAADFQDDSFVLGFHGPSSQDANRSES